MQGYNIEWREGTELRIKKAVAPDIDHLRKNLIKRLDWTKTPIVRIYHRRMNTHIGDMESVMGGFVWTFPITNDPGVRIKRIDSQTGRIIP